MIYNSLEHILVNEYCAHTEVKLMQSATNASRQPEAGIPVGMALSVAAMQSNHTSYSE